MNQDTIKSAVCLIRTSQAQGTGYLIADGWVGTCAHVVKPNDSDTQCIALGKGENVTLLFGKREYQGVIHNLDVARDAAVIKLADPLTGVTALIPSNVMFQGSRWECYGYPAIADDNRIHISGDISDPKGQYNHQESIQLYSREAAAGDGGQE